MEPRETDARLARLIELLAIDGPDAPVAEALTRVVAAPDPPAFALVYSSLASDGYLDLVSSAGVAAGDAQRFARIPLDLPVPICRAWHSAAETVWSLQAPDALHPVGDWLQRAGADAEIVCLPLRLEATPVGVLSLGFLSRFAVGLHERSVLDGAIGALALWLLASQGASIRSGQPPAPVLTERQRRIVALVRQGLGNAEIGEELGFSAATVKADLAALCRLFGVKTRREVADRAAALGV